MSIPLTLTVDIVEEIETNAKYSVLADCPFCENQLPTDVLDIDWCHGDQEIGYGEVIDTVAVICPTCRAQGPMMPSHLDAYNAWNVDN